MKYTFLKQFGLSDNEILVYTTLVERGILSPTGLVEKTGLHRPSVYAALKKLEFRNLVHRSPKGKRVLFRAASPEAFVDLMDDMQAVIARQIAPLSEVYSSQSEKPTITMYEGVRAIQRAYSLVPKRLKRGDVYYRYSARDIKNIKVSKKDHWIAEYRRLRTEKKLERYVITSRVNKESKKPDMNRCIKTVPENFDLFDHDVSMVIYGNYLLLIDYNTMIAVEIENKMIAHFQKKIFQLLFSLLPDEQK